MKKICTATGIEFEITEWERLRLSELGIALPELCPIERMRRRLMFRNEHTLARRKCDGTGRTIISLFPAGTKFPVYDNEYWWSDAWDAKSYGREFDFSRPFFEQFREMWEQVPKMARIQQGTTENSTFTNAVSNLRNCYLVFSTNGAEDCLYCQSCDLSRDAVDCLWTLRSELMYECVDCSDSYSCTYSQRLSHCSDTHWSSDCVGCQNCFACVGLRQQQFQILNERCSREEWDALMADQGQQSEVLKKLRTLYLSSPRKHAEMLHTEDCTGDYLLRAQRSHACWDCFDIEDCYHCDGLRNAKNCLDMSYYACGGENSGNVNCEAVGHGAVDVIASKLVWGGCHSVAHSYECFASHDLFGCTGLSYDAYCILNRQYLPEEYKILREKIISHMKKTGEWGQFFPPEMSPFGYNETMAQVYLPLGRDAVESHGWRWREESPNAKYDGPAATIPDRIEDADESICDQILTCSVTGKNFRIQKSELKFLKKMQLPLPRICPEERRRRRTQWRNPRQLFDRKCSECASKITTTFSPDRPERVACESCFQKMSG